MNETHEYHEYSEVVPGPSTVPADEYRVVESRPVMAEEYRVVESRPVAQQVQQVSTVRTVVTRDGRLRRITLIIGYFFGVLESLLFLRFVLGLMGANQSSPFAVLLNGITAPFLFLFTGLFGTPSVGANVFDFTILIAIVVYALLAYAIVRLVRLLYARSPA